MKGFGESLNRLWSAAARKGAARRQYASGSEAGGRILSSRQYKNRCNLVFAGLQRFFVLCVNCSFIASQISSANIRLTFG